ncbi:MAG: hypothetical protein QOH03_3740, partial [Kribbellaceae bacterium]|nr:hypothetical protein [Kribbellaceae bacterium]
MRSRPVRRPARRPLRPLVRRPGGRGTSVSGRPRHPRWHRASRPAARRRERAVPRNSRLRARRRLLLDSRAISSIRSTGRCECGSLCSKGGSSGRTRSSIRRATGRPMRSTRTPYRPWTGRWSLPSQRTSTRCPARRSRPTVIASRCSRRWTQPIKPVRCENRASAAEQHRARRNDRRTRPALPVPDQYQPGRRSSRARRFGGNRQYRSCRGSRRTDDDRG